MTALDATAKAARRYQTALAARNAAVVEAIQAGHSLREVAKAAKLTHTAIAKIVSRST